jgi:hypothetical protein
MQNTKNYIEKLFFLVSVRVGIAIVLGFVITLFLTRTALKAYSESDTQSYRQESIFNDAGLSASSHHLTNINRSPAEELIDKPIISMSYDVDKVTPTPTPIFSPSDNNVWLQLAECESHQNWKDDTGNGYYGGLQFSLGAWASVGGSGKPSDTSKEEQIMRGVMLQKVRGWGAWGGCARRLGLN